MKFGTVNLEQKVWMLMCLLGKISGGLGRSRARVVSAAVTRGPGAKLSPVALTDVMASRENFNMNVLTDSDLVFGT